MTVCEGKEERGKWMAWKNMKRYQENIILNEAMPERSVLILVAPFVHDECQHLLGRC